MIDYSCIPCKNDRTRLVLYKYWEGRVSKEYSRLQNIYSDNDKYEDVIIQELFNSKYIEIEGGDRYSEEEGKIHTTQLGVNALSSGRYVSEVKTTSRNKLIKYCTLICSIFASFAGVKILFDILLYIFENYISLNN